MTDDLVPPHGGALTPLLAAPARALELKQQARDLASLTLGSRQLCDLELLLGGAFSPLSGYLTRADHETVCGDMRLADGTLWPIPITLDVPADRASQISSGTDLALRDGEGVPVAILHVEDVWTPDIAAEAELVCGSTDSHHPGVAALLARAGRAYVGGRIEGIALPVHFDFRRLRYTPLELRNEFHRMGWRRIVAYHTDEPMHRLEVEQSTRAAREVGANLLIHAAVGMPLPDDLEHYSRVRAFEAVLEHTSSFTSRLAIVPLARRFAGPREALWHAIVRKNFGASHIIVGDHDGSPPHRDPPGAARDLLSAHADELGIGLVDLPDLAYREDLRKFVPVAGLPADVPVRRMSREEFRARLQSGGDVPDWHSFPGVIDALGRVFPEKSHQGFTVFFTGLSGSGKSTLAKALMARLLEMGDRAVSLLDGDIVRRHLSSELGFSREHRDLNIRRIGFVASEISKNGGIALCAPIAPYARARQAIREMITRAGGGFVLVHVCTPLEVCEQRDLKGLYAKARAGVIKEFTGISDPYETPDDADVSIDTSDLSPEQAVQGVLRHLHREGYLRLLS